MDYLLFIILFIGLLIGAGVTAAALLYYLAGTREVEKKKLQQKISANLTHEFNQEKKEIAQKNKAENNQAKFSRQRLVKKIDEQIEQLNASNKEIETLNYKIKDAEYALNQVNDQLDVARDDHAKLQAAHQKLAADYRNQQVRLELAEADAEETQKYIDMLTQQTEENSKIKDKLLIVINQLRDSTKINEQYKKRLAYKKETPLGEVGLGFKDINGMEPVHVIRLFESGVHSPAEMRERSPQEIASIAGVSYELASSWIGMGHST